MAQLEGNQEENTLTLLCWNSIHAPTLVLQLSPKIFSTRAYRRIAEKAFEHIEQYGEAPAGHLWDLLEPELRRGDEGILLNKTLLSMKELAEHLQPQYVLDRLEHFINKRTLLSALEAAADAAESDDLEAANEALFGVAQPASMADADGIWLSDADAMLGFMDAKDDDKFMIGIDELDKRGIQPARGTMTLLVAPPKKGKSWFLVNCGKTGLQYRKSVLHISLENSAKLTAKRYVQALFSLKKDEATQFKITEFARDVNGALKDIEKPRAPKHDHSSVAATNRGPILKKLRTFGRRARLRIEFFPSGTLTIAKYNALLDKLARVDKFVPDLVIFDYPDLMAVGTSNFRLDLGQLFVKLRGIASQRNHALVTVTQGSREAALAKTVGSTMVSEDFSKIMTADTIITYSQTAKEKKNGLARLFVAAARDAADSYIILISQAYAIGQFCMDSTYMDEFTESAIERIVKDMQGDE